MAFFSKTIQQKIAQIFRHKKARGFKFFDFFSIQFIEFERNGKNKNSDFTFLFCLFGKKIYKQFLIIDWNFLF